MIPDTVLDNEEKFSAAFNVSPDLMAITLVSDGSIIEVNQGYTRLLGYTRAESIGKTTGALAIWANATDRQKFVAALKKNGQITDFETILRRKDGSLVTVLDSARTFTINGQAYILSVAHDITQRKGDELKLLRANRFLKMVNDTNQALIRSTNEASLLDEVCRIVVKEGGYRLAWVGFVEHDAAKKVRPVAQAGYESGYIKAAQITWADTPRGRGPTGTAVRTSQPSIAHNILTDPAMEPWKANAVKHGYQSSIAIPLIHNRQVFGVLNIYATEVAAFDTSEIKILEELANDLAFGITALRTNLELQSSEAKFKSFFHHSAEAMTVINSQGNILEVNNVAIKRYGYTHDEFLQMKAKDLDAPDIPTELEKNFKSTQEKGYTVFERIHLKKDGTKIPVEVSCSPIEYNGQQALLAIIRDISEHKQIEAQLQASEIKYSTLVEQGNDGILILQDKGILKYVNSIICKMTGYTKDEVLNKPFLKYVSPEYREMVADRYIKRLTGQDAPSRYEIDILSKDGQTSSVEINSSKIEYEGRPAVMAIVRDITERKKAASIARASELSYRRLFEAARDGILLIDFKTGMIMDVNPYLVELLGYSKEDFLKKYLWEVGVFRDVAASKANFLTLQKKRYVRFEDLPLETKTGKKVEVEFVANAYQVDGTTIIQCNVRNITDRKKSEEELRKSEARFRAIFDATFQFTGLMTPDGILVEANQAAIDYTGLKPADVLNRPFWDTPWWKGDKQRIKKLKLAVKQAAQGKFIRYETELSGTNHSQRTFDFSIKPILDQDKKVILLIPEGRDISDRKNSEIELQKNEAFMRATLESTDDGILAINNQGKVIHTNNRFSQLWKIPQKLIDKKDDNLLLSFVLDQLADPKAFLAKVKKMYRSDKTDLDILNFKDNRIFERFSTPLILNGQIEGRVWSFRDITQRIKNEQTIIEAKAKNDAILASIGDAVIACDRQGQIVLFNQVAEELIGQPAQKTIGQHYSQVLSFVKEVDGKPGNDFIAEAISTGKIKAMVNHTMLVRKDGIRVPIAEAASPVRDTNGKILGAVVVFRDVTEERQVDKAKTEFVSLASHELRTPLSTINWYAEMLLSNDLGELNPKQKQYIKEAYQASQRMVDLVNALLNVSRLELGTFSIEPELVNVVKIAQTCVEELRPQITRKKIKFLEKYDSSLPLIKADPKLMSMVFQNLLSNAVKYTTSGGKVTFNIKKNDQNMLIEVADTGIGIPKYQQEKIFSKLFRADNVKRMDSSGTGLGLYIIKEIMDHSGGKVWFKSSENKGSIFYLSLPLSGMNKKTGTRKLV